MMNNKYFIKLAIPLVLLLWTSVYSEEPTEPHKATKAEVEDLISKVQKKLDTIKNSPLSDVVRFEIMKIEDHIKSTTKLLEDKEIDQAYYEISIGIIYFPLIDAHLDRYKADQELEQTKKKYGK